MLQGRNATEKAFLQQCLVTWTWRSEIGQIYECVQIHVYGNLFCCLFINSDFWVSHYCIWQLKRIDHNLSVYLHLILKTVCCYVWLYQSSNIWERIQEKINSWEKYQTCFVFRNQNHCPYRSHCSSHSSTGACGSSFLEKVDSWYCEYADFSRFRDWSEPWKEEHVHACDMRPS